MLTAKHVAYLSTLHGWASPEKIKRLYDLVIEVNEPDNKSQWLSIVELGTFAGRSILPMALACKDIDKGMCYALDSWDNITPLEGTNKPENDAWWSKVNMDFIFERFTGSIEFLGLEKYITVRKCKSYEIANEMPDDSVSILHQDSTHNEEIITKELEVWAPKMKLGSYWVCDDTNWEETKTGYAKLPDYGFELFESFDTWAIYKKVK